MTNASKPGHGNPSMTKDEQQVQLSLAIAAIAISIRCVKLFGQTTGERLYGIVEQELAGICDDRWPNFNRAQWCKFVRMGFVRAYDPGGPLGSSNGNTVQ